MMQVVSPVARDLGGFSVRRILPSIERRSIGPFVFFDEMGPLTLKTGLELEVRPHPHIGLATLTWLFSGAMMHRDSLGSVQVIHPGAVNLMTAGQGIVHSERVSQSGMKVGDTIHGAQFWLGLPQSHEACEPAFAHHPAAEIPEFHEPGVTGRVVIGSYREHRSPVPFPDSTSPHPVLCLDLTLEPGAAFTLPPDSRCPERAYYSVDGEGAHTFFIPDAGAPLTVSVETPTRVLVIGGAPLDGPRHLDWNFVASSRERLAQARDDWRAGRFASVPGETEFIPYPDSKPA